MSHLQLLHLRHFSFGTVWQKAVKMQSHVRKNPPKSIDKQKKMCYT